MAKLKVMKKRAQNVFLGAKKGYLKTVYKPGVGGLDEEVEMISKKINNNSDYCRTEIMRAKNKKVKRLEEKKEAKIDKAKKRAERRQAIHDWLFVDDVEDTEVDLDDNIVIIQNSDFRDSKFMKYSKKISCEDLVGRNYNTSPLYVFHNGSYYKVDSVTKPKFDLDNQKATLVIITEAMHFCIIYDIKIQSL